jgi:preprotein translocase subunit SecA
MFQAMLDRIEEETVRALFHVQPVVESEIRQPERRERPLLYRQPGTALPDAAPPSIKAGPVRTTIPKKRKK